VLEIVASDSTFEPFDLHDRPAWAGKCIHCNSRLVVLAEGNPVGSGHGGTPGSDLGRRHRRRGETSRWPAPAATRRAAARRAVWSHRPVGGGGDPPAAKAASRPPPAPAPP